MLDLALVVAAGVLMGSMGVPLPLVRTVAAAAAAERDEAEEIAAGAAFWRERREIKKKLPIPAFMG